MTHALFPLRTRRCPCARRSAAMPLAAPLLAALLLAAFWSPVVLTANGDSPQPPAPKQPAPKQPAPKQPPEAQPSQGQPSPEQGDAESARRPPLELGDVDKPPSGLKRLSPKHEVWIDPQRKLVVVGGYVCLRQGPLEMFACPKGTKEHESVVALNCLAYQVHAALVAVGAEPGHPVRFEPKYEPAAGTEVGVEVLWRDPQGELRRTSAQQWIRNHDTGKPLAHHWVFGGSRLYKDPMSDTPRYLAEEGDLICVSNFVTATLDLPIKSSADAGSLVFVANTDEIPKEKTPVRVVLIPKLAPAKDAAPNSP